MTTRQTLTLTRAGLPSIEYRRAADSTAFILRLEHRELKPDGTPHDDRFYAVDDAGLLWMQRLSGGTDIIDRLAHEQQAETTRVIHYELIRAVRILAGMADGDRTGAAEGLRVRLDGVRALVGPPYPSREFEGR